MKNRIQFITAITPVRQLLHRSFRRRTVTTRLTVVITTLMLSAAAAWAAPQGRWSPTGSMAGGRFAFTATTIQNGMVLVAGGADSTINLNTAELYDPVAGTFTPTGSMHEARVGFSATRLPNGKVLVEGGFNNTVRVKSAEIYDPATGTWSITASMKQPREAQSAILLNDGTVLVTGGSTVDFNGVTVASAELYNPTTGRWTATGSMLQSRERHTATVLQNGQVLIAGGDFYDGVNGGALAECELYDPTLGTWSA